MDKDKKIILFVGTSHTPNNEAANKLVKYLDLVGHEPVFEEFKFIIVGECFEKRRGHIWESLGSIDFFSLSNWYKRSFAVLNLQKNGSGISIKTVEALMQNKILLSTVNGVRGLEVVKNENYFEINDVEDIKETLIQIKDSPSIISEIQIKNKRFKTDHHFLKAQHEIIKGDEIKSNNDSNFNWEKIVREDKKFKKPKIEISPNFSLMEFNSLMLKYNYNFIEFIKNLDLFNSNVDYKSLNLLTQHLFNQECSLLQLEHNIKIDENKSLNYLIFALLIEENFNNVITFTFYREGFYSRRINLTGYIRVKNFYSVISLITLNKHLVKRVIKILIRQNGNFKVLKLILKIYKYLQIKI